MSGWNYYPELLATPVPRYTSYPTAAEFSDAVGTSEMEAALAAHNGATVLDWKVIADGLSIRVES